MRMQLVAGALALLVAGPASAQDFEIRVDLFGQKKAAPKPPAIDWNQGAAVARNRTEPKVVCGMTVVPADPKVDPKMRVAPRADGTTYAMTVVPPTVCRP